MLGNEEDFTACLGFQVEGADDHLLHLDVSAFRTMIEAAVRALSSNAIAIGGPAGGSGCALFGGGAGQMDRRRFFTWSFVGAVLWATGVTLLGYFLGGIPFLQKNIEAALVAIVLVSVLPMVIEWWRHRARAGRAASLGD